MWDERVVAAIVKAAREDLQQQKWARDFADKLKERGITISLLNRAIIDADAVVLYRHKGRYVVGFCHERLQIVAAWSPRHPSRWVTSFRRPEVLRYLLRLEGAELLWAKR